MLESVGIIEWQEYVGRRVQDFDPPSLCIVLNAAMRLRALDWMSACTRR